MKKGNKAVIFSILGVAAALGITIYLLTRKSKKIDNQVSGAAGNVSSGSFPGGIIADGSYVPPYTPPYVAGGGNTLGSGLTDINTELGIKNYDTSGGNTEKNSRDEMGHGDRV
jgi:hypothetical protein